MDGLISAYRLSNEAGRRIASIKAMPKAWSDPTFLPNIFSNPGPLLVYNKLYIDQRSYEDFYDDSDNNLRPLLKKYIESKALDIFSLINAESILSVDEGDVFEVEHGFRELNEDIQFKRAVEDIKNKWGHYAAPSPIKFESMNIPVVELLCEKWSKKLNKEIFIVDNFERAILYNISWKKKFSKIISPETSKIMIDMLPKFFTITPNENVWTVDSIKRLRENEYWNSYKNKIDQMSKKASKKFEKYVTKLVSTDNNTTIPKNHIINVDSYLNDLQSIVYDEILDSLRTVQNHLSVNKWSVLGGFTAISGAALSQQNPKVGMALGVAGGIITLTDQSINFIKRKMNNWVSFIEAISHEVNKNYINKNTYNNGMNSDFKS